MIFIEPTGSVPLAEAATSARLIDMSRDVAVAAAAGGSGGSGGGGQSELLDQMRRAREANPLLADSLELAEVPRRSGR